MRRAVFASAILLAGLAFFSHALLSQQTAFTVVSKDGRRPLAITVQNEQDFVALDDLASMFQLAVREDALGVTVSYKGKTVDIKVGGRELKGVPVWVLPGHPDKCGTLYLGYGRRAPGLRVAYGEDGKVGFNAYSLRPSTARWNSPSIRARLCRAYSCAQNRSLR